VREEAFSDLLSHYEVKGESFLSQTVTGDEPQTQRQSMEGHHPTSPQKMMFKAIPSVGKVMDIVFWDAEGVVLVDIMPCGQTITQICTFKHLKHCRSVSGDFNPKKNVADDLLQCNAVPNTNLKIWEVITTFE